MKFRKLTSPIVAAILSLPSLCNAAYVFSGASITEDFNGLPTTTTNGFFSGTVGTQTAVTGTNFLATKVGGTGTTGANFVADTGAGNAGAIYSYGAAASSERALGMIASGSQIMAMGFEVTNSSALTITSVTVNLTGEFWRSSTSTQNVFVVETGDSTLSGVTSSNFLTATGFTTTTPLTGPAPVTSNGALDGNDVANQTAYSTTITGLNLAPGSSFYIRWTDANEVGNDAGIALDNMTVSFTTVPEASSAVFGALGMLALLRRRRA